MQPKIDYQELIRKSLCLAWQNKHLWWFGLFIALTNSGGSFSFSSDQAGWEELSGFEFGQSIFNFISDHVLLIAFLIISATLIFLCLFILSFISRAGLIYSISSISQEETNSFRSGFAIGKKHIYRLLGLSFLIGFSILAVLIMLVIPIATLFLMGSYMLGAMLIFVAVVILIPLIFIASFLRIYGQLYLVLSNLDIWSSIEAAYALLRKNIGSSIIMSLIFLGLGMLAMMALLPPVMIFFAFGSMFYKIFDLLGLMLAFFLGILFLLPTFLAFRSFYETFSQALWFFFFQEIAKPKTEEVIAEMAEDKKLAPDANPDPVVYLDK